MISASKIEKNSIAGWRADLLSFRVFFLSICCLMRSTLGFTPITPKAMHAGSKFALSLHRKRKITIIFKT